MLLDHLLAFAILWVAVYGLIILHEAAHLMAGLAVGFSIRRVTIGSGRVACRTRFIGIPIEFRWVPWGGEVFAGPYRPRGLRWRAILFALAGPAVDIGVLAVLLRPSVIRWLVDPSAVPWNLAAQVLLIIIVVDLFSNLVPDRDGSFNDGAQLWTHLTGKTVEYVKNLANHQSAVARYDPSFDLYESSVLLADPDVMEEWIVSLEQFAKGHIDEGIAGLLRILNSVQLPPGERAMLLDRIACISLEKGGERFLPQAIECAKEAHRLYPKSKTISGTIGSLFVENGNYREGIDLLLPLATPENDPTDQHMAARSLAKAYQGLGDLERAAQWSKTAAQTKT